MPLELAQSIVGAIGTYLVIGVAIATAFLTLGLRRLDPIAAAGPVRFKLMIAPGIVALWPIMIMLWASGRGADR